MEFSRSCAAWQFPLSLAGCFALVYGQHWRPSHPSPMQSNSLLSVAGRVAGSSEARVRSTNYPIPKFEVCTEGFVGRGGAAARFVWRGGYWPIGYAHSNMPITRASARGAAG